jgi:predicted TIM-barrel fold metal-dependent hydrolase
MKTSKGRAMDHGGSGIVSVDDHIIEPPHLWQNRLAQRYQAEAPRVVRMEPGVDGWSFNGEVIPVMGMATAAGRDAGGYSNTTTYDQMRPGCYDPTARLADLDMAGVAASACFPNWAGFSGTRLSAARERDLSLACIQAYNDFVLDEWCGAAPDRYIPVILVPLWDPRAAAGEMVRTAGRGARAVAFSENPSAQGYPSIHAADGHWDPVFDTAQQTGMPLCLHIGSSSHIYQPPSPDSPITVAFTTDFLNAQYTLIEWIFSGVFDRFKGLQICLSEGGVGWIPHCLERCDMKYDRYADWAGCGPVRRPSEYVADHIWVCLLEDIFGSGVLEVIGLDNVLVEVDYPHADSSWPRSSAIIADRLARFSAGDQAKVGRGNAERLFHFEAADLSAAAAVAG